YPRLLSSHASCDAGPIMIAQNPVGPGPQGESCFIRIDYLANSTGIPGWHGHQLKIEGQLNLVELLTVIPHHALHCQIKLADENAFVVRVYNGTHLSHDLVNVLLISRVEVELANFWRIARLPIRIHWIIAELLILEQQPQNVDAKAIDAPVEPEAQHIIHSLAHAGITPV